jgi:hypothetical protein
MRIAKGESSSVLALATAILLGMLGCGHNQVGDQTSGSGGDSSQSSTGAMFLTSGAGGSDGCADDARLVYVLGSDRQLLSFDPPTLALTQVGIVTCPVNGGPAVPTPTPFSMAIDRSGFAWVLYNDGSLFHMDVKHPEACAATAYKTAQLTGFDLFGMGFVSDTPGSQNETLYLGAYDGAGIGKLDLQTLQIQRIGYYDKISGPAEMTGTGDSRLFGFFLSNPVQVAELDKDTSRVISKRPLDKIHIGGAWAFAFWGGDFWLFTSPDGPTSHIDRYSPSDGTTTRMVDDAGIQIVGAGVSTCAPVVPPN